MRIGLLSDVHGNAPALRAVLETLRVRGAEQILVAGDIVGYGAQPNECITMLAETDAWCVAGNHDLFVLDRLPPTRFPDLARRSAELTRAVISRDSRAFLESLPLRRQVGSILMTHGSLDSPEEYVVDEAHAQDLLRRLPQEAPGSDTLVLGHTHRQWHVVADVGLATAPDGGRRQPVAARLLNPGSVGQSRQRERRPGARAALYDSDTHDVEFLRLDYDVEAGLRALQGLGLPDRCLHAPPRIRDRAVGVTRRFVRPLRGAWAGRR
jgi:predicted phosphodiesterase